ncbi:ATP-dependent helicase [bacterium]|nr:ATP-dependent helicase [bacterium]
MSDVQLTSQQREAVEHGKGPLLIIAGAGTGKTLVITRRIAHLIESKMARPEEVLAVTFTEKAAAEMAERVDVLLPYGYANVQISTFHAFGDRILREFALVLGLNPDFYVMSQAEQIVFCREHLFEFPLKHYRPLSEPTRFIQALLSVISRAKDEDVSPEDYWEYIQSMKKKSDRQNDDREWIEEIENQEEIAGTYQKYQELMVQESKVDFGDQVSLAVKLFREHPSVLRQVQARYQFILVDEFQDTNYAQFQLIQLLGGEQANVTVVGDDDQSIYKFRGAAISNILGFMDIYPQARQVILTENFRSTQVILDAAYKLIQHNNPDRLEVRNCVDKQLVGQRKEGPIVEHFHCDTLLTETDRVAQLIADFVENKQYGYSDIAILVRANQSADPFLKALNMKSIPWRFSGNRGLYTCPEIKLLISFLKVLSDPENSIHLYHLASSDVYEWMSMEELHRCVNLARRENRSLYAVFKSLNEIEDLQDLSADTRVSAAKLVKDIQHYLEMSRDQITGVVLYQFLTNSNYLKRLTQQESVENSIKIQNIAKFFDVVWAFAQVAREDRLIHFVDYLDLLIEAGDDPGTAEADPDMDAVNVLTVHKAKGLEWPVVFMVSLIHNRFPHTQRKDPIELPDDLVKEILPKGDFHLQEERRLFYVGMTRAKDRLIFTSAQDYGGVGNRKVSPFVLEALDRPHLDLVSMKTGALDKIRRFASVQEETVQTTTAMSKESILNLSHYQVDDYETCPLKYKYVHILRLPFFHHTIIYGKAVHAAVELYFRHKMNSIPVSVNDLQSAYKMAWRNIGFLSREHEERRFEAGLEVIRQFFEREETAGHVPKFIEEPFSFMLGKNRISGRWDRVDEREGQIVIVDFKTSEVHKQDAADRRVKESLQLVIYAMAYAIKWDRLPDRIELHFIESGLVGSAEVNNKMFQKVEEVITRTAEGIRRRDYAPNPSYQSCKYCAYTEICPSGIKV